MLVLRRRAGERFKVGSSEVHVLKFHGGKVVSLGIDAPAEVLVLRSELVKESNRAVTPPDVFAAGTLTQKGDQLFWIRGKLTIDISDVIRWRFPGGPDETHSVEVGPR